MAISMLKIRRPLGRLIFNMGIAIPGKTVFLIETAPWPLSVKKLVFFPLTSHMQDQISLKQWHWRWILPLISVLPARSARPTSTKSWRRFQGNSLAISRTTPLWPIILCTVYNVHNISARIPCIFSSAIEIYPRIHAELHVRLPTLFHDSRG